MSKSDTYKMNFRLEYFYPSSSNISFGNLFKPAADVTDPRYSLVLDVCSPDTEEKSGKSKYLSFTRSKGGSVFDIPSKNLTEHNKILTSSRQQNSFISDQEINNSLCNSCSIEKNMKEDKNYCYRSNRKFFPDKNWLNTDFDTKMNTSYGLSYLVGGFVGSKSQQNVDHCFSYQLCDVICNKIEEFLIYNSTVNHDDDSNKKYVNNCSDVATLEEQLIQPVLFDSTVSNTNASSTDCDKYLSKQCENVGSSQSGDRNYRQHKISECSTDSDSFVIFEEVCGKTIPYCVDYSDDDASSISEENDWICDEDLEDEEDIRQLVEDANERWNAAYKKEAISENPSERKVQFSDKIVVHHMIAWNFAYRAARIGCWMRAVTDRERFQRRISHIKGILSPILSKHHRQNIYTQRFAETTNVCTPI